jgi:predicted GNAT family acetyltransferase
VSTESAQIAVRDNPDELRYELVVDGEVAGEILYRRRSDAVVLIHTEVAPKFQHHGLGERLVADALADIHACGLRPVVVCPFVRAYMQRHPEASG